MSKKNQYGLSRTIPKEIKEKILDDAGYGCIFCGSLLYDIEHIDPEFANAKTHDPSKMTLLCQNHHARKTRKENTKTIIFQQKERPFCKEKGNAKHNFIFENGYFPIKITTNVYQNINIIVNCAGKALFWIDYKSRNEPVLINLLLKDINDELLCSINNNELDIQSKTVKINKKANRYQIINKNKIILDFELHDDKITFNYIEIWHKRNCIILNDKGFCINGEQKQIFSNNTIIVNTFGMCLVFIPIPLIVSQQVNKQQYTSIKRHNGITCGHINIQNILFNLDMIEVGYVKDNICYNTIGDYSGTLIDNCWIVLDDNQKIEQPFYIPKQGFNPCGLKYKYDLSYILF